MNTLTVRFIDMDSIAQIWMMYQGSQPLNSTISRRQRAEE